MPIKPPMFMLLVWLVFVISMTLALEVDTDGVEITEVSDVDSDESMDMFDTASKRPGRSKRQATGESNIIKSYIDKLKPDQEIVISSGPASSGGVRYKSGDIHIRKGSSNSHRPLEITEPKKLQYTYPFGLGAFLMSGCYQFTGMTNGEARKNTEQTDYDVDSMRRRRRKRATAPLLTLNQTNDFKSFCERYAVLEPATRQCTKIIPGSYTLGTGYDVKFESSENARRKSVITRYCNYQKYFGGYAVADTMTANGIYDTKTQTMSFGQSGEYMKFVASRSNLDRYTNVFSSDTKNAYGGINDMKNVKPATGDSDETSNLDKTASNNAAKTTSSADFWLFQIQSTILLYDLILDQITPWTIDPDMLVDFLMLPESYFHPDALEKFGKFIADYGTHVVVSAKFGGEFKITRTMRKSQSSSLEAFAQKCTQDSMKMFSRSWSVGGDALVAKSKNSGSKNTTDTKKKQTSSQKEQSATHMDEYASTFLSVKGGSQEVAAIVASMGQPDFSDTFIGWLRTVHQYPRAFDYKYESIVSVLEVNARTLFANVAAQERRICNDYARALCRFGFTVEQFAESWSRKLRALQFAITVYLKEPTGLITAKFTIPRGDSACRFNIINYLAPFWREINSATSDAQYHITFNLHADETNDGAYDEAAYLLKRSDEVYFKRREEFWMSARKSDSTENAQLVKEPFKSALDRHLINIFGLILEYNERDATVTVVNVSRIIEEYSSRTGCQFKIRGLNSPSVSPLVNITSNATNANSTISSILPFLAYVRNATHSVKHSFRRDYFHAVKRQSHSKQCSRLHAMMLMSMRRVKNMRPFWVALWQKVVGVVDYVDPIQAVIRTWDVKFAVLPCQLKWSNNLMMIIAKRPGEGQCLRFMAATEGEIFVAIATTPSDQNTWYIFQITTRGVIFYREGRAVLLNEDSAAGTTGVANILQAFFICLNYENRTLGGASVFGLYIQYGIELLSEESSHLYLSYFDRVPLEPMYYSFGSRNAEVKVAKAHLEPLDVTEQVQLRCNPSSTLNKATETICDYMCHSACLGCTAAYSITACRRCAFASVLVEPSSNNNVSHVLCLERCPLGYGPDINKNMLCIDINECNNATLNECQANTQCENTVGSYKCSCLEGFLANGLFCEDIDECALRVHNCSTRATCLNTLGSFICSCLPGFSGDGVICSDINECQLQLDDCAWDRTCNNLIGSFECVCAEGFKQIQNACIEIDECALFNHTCEQMGALCQNVIGGYECICRLGFAMFEDSCHDINECHTLANDCDPQRQHCLNTQGGFRCECNLGLQLDSHSGNCVDVNECEGHASVCDSDTSVCINEQLGFRCACKIGFYELNGVCVDINECHLERHNCFTLAACINTVGSFYCDCGVGFDTDKTNGNKCLDIDECALGTHDCGVDATCHNTYGSFYCKCLQGLELSVTSKKCVEPKSDGINMSCEILNGISVCTCDKGFQFSTAEHQDDSQVCIDIDECVYDANVCGPHADCVNEYGSFTCTCHTGFAARYSDGAFACDDIDECATLCTNDCDGVYAECVNTPGEYACRCKKGLYGTGKSGECFDVDECALELNTCPQHSYCVNSFGSYRCVCDKGFYRNGTSCENINECIDLAMGSECTKRNAVCVDTLGSFECRCLFGFRAHRADGLSLLQCIDVNECSEQTHTCPEKTMCVNTVGAYTCLCSSGYMWSPHTRDCQDIDECEGAVAVCDDHATCVNTEGSFRCVCDVGWSIATSLNFCADIDECAANTSHCAAHALCVNKPGTYSCQCEEGFEGDGMTSCVDRDECITASSVVCRDPYYRCVNTPGSYECVCIDGFIRATSGVCVDIDECELHHPCGENSLCVNTLGAYRCDCVSGFTKISSTSKECIDIDECSDESVSSVCGRFSRCDNTYGSYNCSCLPGFFGDGRGDNCVDVDECALIEDPDDYWCNRTGRCINTVGFHRCDCLSGFAHTNGSNVCTDIDECEYESCFSKSLINGELCYAFGLCRNMFGSFVCECFNGFEYDDTYKHCIDIDECARLRDDLQLVDYCATDVLHVATCINVCGNFTCICKDTDVAVVDIYEPLKCYTRRDVRDFVFYLYLSRESFNAFFKRVNVTLTTCKDTAPPATFQIEFSSFHQFLMQINTQRWFPTYIDNSQWSSIEFVCQIQLTVLSLVSQSTTVTDFRYLMMEDPTRRRCSLYSTESAHTVFSAKRNTKIFYRINTVWNLQNTTQTCENMLELGADVGKANVHLHTVFNSTDSFWR